MSTICAILKRKKTTHQLTQRKSAALHRQRTCEASNGKVACARRTASVM